MEWSGSHIRWAAQIGLLNTLDGLRFVFTGSLSRSRTEFESLVIWLGGNVSSAVTVSTSFLVMGKNNGVSKLTAKTRAALDKGTPVIDEDEFMRMVISRRVLDIYGV